jgi:hypothetical protein
MLNPERISIGRVKPAYGLNENEVEDAVQALWPGNVFPLELWRRTYERFWRASADGNQALYKVEGPALPELDTSKKYFHIHLCALDVMTFFKKISEIIHVKILREGFKYILESSYEEIDAVFPEEREFLFNMLLKMETIYPSYQYYWDSEDDFNLTYEDKILCIPHSSYHFIANIFPNTMLVDTVAVIRHFRNYPLRQEVKGLTQRLVNLVLDSPEPKTPDILETTIVQVASTADDQPHNRKLVFRIPASLWEGKPDAAVRDAMKDEYPLEVIAFVLMNWCGVKPRAGHKTPKGRKTHVGRLLSGKEFKDDKSYRNFVDSLLEAADSYSIVKA